MYRWTRLDVGRAKAGKQRLTPYHLPLTAFSDATKTEAGTSVPLPFDQFAYLPSVGRFDLGDDFTWDAVPPAFASAKTIGELCAKLHATGSPKYPDRFYDVKSMSPEVKMKVASLLFEHWENTDYRYAVIASEKFTDFNLDLVGDPFSLIPATASYTNARNERVVETIKVIPVAKAGARSGAAAPGPTAQSVKLPDPDLALLDADITEMRLKVRQLQILLNESREVIKERMLCASRFTALKVLLQTCASASQSAPATNDLAAKACELEKKSHARLRSVPATDLLKQGGQNPVVVSEFRKKIGMYENLTEGVEVLRDGLCAKLTKDTAFAGRCVEFARHVIDKKLQSSAEYEQKRSRLILSLVEVAWILQETGTSTEFSEKLFQILEKAPESPAVVGSGLREGSALDTIFSLLGPRSFCAIAYGKVLGAAAQLAGSVVVGNLAGPANAYIAYAQLRAWQTAEKNLAKAMAGEEAFIDAYRQGDDRAP
ncbi:MAG: hypothetical protein ABI193_24060 [Minicystis sp.]